MKYIITGIISGLKTGPNANNFNRTDVTKMTVTDKDGTRYSGTRPISLVDAKEGDKVGFTADLERSHLVPKWFWFKRPRAASVLEAA